MTICDMGFKKGDSCAFVTISEDGNEIKLAVRVVDKLDEYYQIQGNFLDKFIVPKDNKFYAHADELTYLPALEIIK